MAFPLPRPWSAASSTVRTSGNEAVAVGGPREGSMGVTWKHLLVLVLVLSGVIAWIIQSPYEHEARFPMPAGKTYVAECGSCHTAFAPGLLPVRSWHQMMNQLADHFGEDASLDEPHHLAILKELETLAADGSYADQRMRRISEAIAPGSQPQRISETAFFKYTHDEVPPDFWKRQRVGKPSNCIACHPRANEGRYDERDVRIPGR